jgi:hypothetical protein
VIKKLKGWALQIIKPYKNRNVKIESPLDMAERARGTP